MTHGEPHATLEMLEAHAIAEGREPRLIYLGVLGASDLALVVDGVAVVARGADLVVDARSREAADAVSSLFSRLTIEHATRREIVLRLCQQLDELRVYVDRAAALDRKHRRKKRASLDSGLGDCADWISAVDVADCGCQLIGAVADAGCDVGCL